MQKCIVPACQNCFGGSESSTTFFNVPSFGFPVFKKWKQFMHLSGKQTEKICEAHFTSEDIVENRRVKLKSTAAPSLNLPKTSNKVRTVGGAGICCIRGCRTREVKSLNHFPSKNRTRAAWVRVLQIPDEIRTSLLMICNRHIKNTDFCTVTSKYLKPSAVPSRKIARLIRRPRRCLQSAKLPDHLLDHSYSKYDALPRSNRICFVDGCLSRAAGGIKLHRFPKPSDPRYRAWIRILKCTRKPTTNSRVCSVHFANSSYCKGGKHLRKDALPSLNIPGKHTEDVDCSYLMSDSLVTRNNNYPTKKDSDEQQDLCVKESDEQQDIEDISCQLLAAGSDDDQSAQLGSGFEHINCEDKPHCISSSWTQTDQPTNCSAPSNVAEATQIIDTTTHVILSDLLTTDKDLNVWTGITTMDLLSEICLAVKKLEECKMNVRKFKMHTTDRVILVISKLKQDISLEALGTLFRISGTTASVNFSHTLEILSKLMKRFVYWPSKEVKKNIPLCFREHFSNCTIVLDCTEIAAHTPKCLNCRISLFSNYKPRRTVKFLIGVTPAGLISFVSTAYTSKSSDKFIFNGEKLIDRLQPHINEVMVDKGVTIEHELASKCIKLHIPPFMRGERLTPAEASKNEAIARARIHVERAIQRIKIFAIMSNCISSSMMVHMDDIMITICGIVNLSHPILSGDKF